MNLTARKWPAGADGMVGLGEDLPSAGWKQTWQILMIHAGRSIEHGRQLTLKLRKARTEELQAALKNLGEQSTLPG